MPYKHKNNMPKEVIISNSNLNSYGFRVLTSGIDTGQFERNPILLWMHNRPFRGTTDEVLPLGRVENLRVEGDNLIGTPVFDESDDFALRIKAKWDSGILKMVSAGLDVLDQSEEPSVLVQGQTRSTVTRSKLREVSIVDLGANDDALVLYHEGKTVNLAGCKNEDLSFLNPIDNNLNNKGTMKAIALKLGLPETATEQEVLAKLGELQTQAAEAANIRLKMAEQTEQAIAAAVDSAVKLRKITADKKDHFVELGKMVGLESLNETLNLMQPAKRPTDMIDQSQGGATEYKKLSDVPTNRLMQLRADDPETYKTLYKAEYGINPIE